MGNSGSRHQHLRQQALSSRYHQHKVLLDLDNTPRLRPTQNGAILHNGGTISQRHRDHFGGSEPDLRFSGTRREPPSAAAAAAAAAQLRVARNNNRKKYKAPSTPQQEWDPLKQPSRRLRLFVTRAEAKRKERVSPDVPEPPPAAVERPLPPTGGGRLRRSLSTPHFQQEERVPPQDQPPANSFLEELRQKQLMREERTRRSESRLSRRPEEIKKHPPTKTEEEWLERPPPVKTFYFGMDEPVDDPFGFDSFSPKPAASFSSSNESRASEGFQDGEDSGISVHLRATLPRKQVDIPRFSPAAAWRLLSSAEFSLPPPIPPQEEEVIESRIIAPPPITVPTLLPDKSADSGISGDASPQQLDSAAWTPQQDLEETSSDGWPADFLRDLKYTPRLSLSLPNKEEQEKPTFTFVKPFPDIDNNWVLSSSIPSSVNHPQEDDSLVKKPSFNYLTAGGHIMYLPEYSTHHTSELEESRNMSKSCENLAHEEQLRYQQSFDYGQGKENEKPKKFAFQSTIRQRERKVLADKLARIAEYTEQKRKSEQEVMRKVEEEFQRKREREKADIRQQLRLYNINNRAQLDSLETSISNP